MTTTTPLIIEEIAQHKLLPHPDNPPERSRIENAKDLGASILAHGLFEPLVVRPIDGEVDTFQIVIGHRRKQGTIVAGLQTATCIVKEMTDEEAAFVRLVDGIQHEEIAPLDEAKGYELLLTTVAGTVEKLALRVGKSIEHVKDRLRLLDLVQAVAVRIPHRLTVDHALLIARLPESLQVEAANALEKDDTVMPLKDAARLIRARFTLRLEMAPFDRGDPELHEEAGPCTTCQKRSGVQAELLADVATPDLCLDLACFETKRERSWTARAGDAETKGKPVFTGRETKAAIDSGDYIALDAKVPGAEDWTWRTAIGTGARKLPIVLARDDAKQVHELVPREHLREAKLNDKAKSLFTQYDQAQTESAAQAAGEKKREDRKAAQRKQALDEVTAVVSLAAPTTELLRELARLVVTNAWPDVAKEVGKRRFGSKVDKPAFELIALAEGETAGGALALAFEVLLAKATQGGEDPRAPGSPIARVLAAVGETSASAPPKTKGAKKVDQAPEAKLVESSLAETPAKGKGKKKHSGVPAAPKKGAKGKPVAKKGKAS